MTAISVTRFLNNLGYKFSLKIAQILVAFGAILKMGLFNLKLPWIAFGQLSGKLGYFKFQHLVTVTAINVFI